MAEEVKFSCQSCRSANQPRFHSEVDLIFQASQAPCARVPRDTGLARLGKRTVRVLVDGDGRDQETESHHIAVSDRKPPGCLEQATVQAVGTPAAQA